MNLVKKYFDYFGLYGIIFLMAAIIWALRMNSLG